MAEEVHVANGPGVAVWPGGGERKRKRRLGLGGVERNNYIWNEWRAGIGNTISDQGRE